MNPWAERFLSRAFADAEARSLWPRVWTPIAPSRAVRSDGFWLAELDGSWLLTRDAHGDVVVQPNACPHRGARLLDGPCVGDILCAVHGRRVAAGAGDDRARRCTERHGFVWLGGPGAPDLVEFLGPVDTLLGGRELCAWSVGAELHVDCAANWKFGVEVHLDATHGTYVHRALGERVPWHQARIESLGPHGRIVVPGGNDGDNEMIFVFPSTQVNLHPREGVVFRQVPDRFEPRRSRFVQWTVHVGAARLAEPERVVSADPRVGPVTAADLAVAERFQRGAEEGAVRPDWDDGDQLVRGFHLAVEAALR